jgi:hypothetical protein
MDAATNVQLKRVLSFLSGETVCDKSCAILSGFLRKEGANVRSWKLRFFCLLSGGVVLYFKSPEAERPLGGFCLGPDAEVSGGGGVLKIASARSCTAAQAPTAGRVFSLKGEVGDLQAWEVALHNCTTDQIAVNAPPFLAYNVADAAPAVAAPSGLSLSAQRSMQDKLRHISFRFLFLKSNSEYFKRLHLEKLRRVLLHHDDLVLVVDWVALDRQNVENVGALVYNTVLGSLADRISVQAKRTREAIVAAWSSPILRFELCRDEQGVSIENGELLVRFQIDKAAEAGADVEKKFGGEASAE